MAASGAGNRSGASVPPHEEEDFAVVIQASTDSGASTASQRPTYAATQTDMNFHRAGPEQAHRIFSPQTLLGQEARQPTEHDGSRCLWVTPYGKHGCHDSGGSGSRGRADQCAVSGTAPEGTSSAFSAWWRSFDTTRFSFSSAAPVNRNQIFVPVQYAGYGVCT